MRTSAFLALAVFAACASPAVDNADVSATATAESGGLRVWFRQNAPTDTKQRARFDVTVETVETAVENVEFKVPRVLREPV